MTITYEFGKNLYVNTTNRCSCACEFCLREHGDTVGNSGSLWLPREPEKEEILADIEKRDLKKYEEIVFCGYGEPAYRLKDILWVCEELKKKHTVKIRLDTNGHGTLLLGENAAALMRGKIDTVSVSLNAASKQKYAERCRPIFGEDAYDAMLEFAHEAVKTVPKVIMTVVDLLPEEEINQCRIIAESIGAEFRVRDYIEN